MTARSASANEPGIDEYARSIDWATEADRLLLVITDAMKRADFRDLYDERLAICLADDISHWRAAKTAYIDVAVAIVASGITFSLRSATDHGGVS